MTKTNIFLIVAGIVIALGLSVYVSNHIAKPEVTQVQAPWNTKSDDPHVQYCNELIAKTNFATFTEANTAYKECLTVKPSGKIAIPEGTNPKLVEDCNKIMATARFTDETTADAFFMKCISGNSDIGTTFDSKD